MAWSDTTFFVTMAMASSIHWAEQATMVCELPLCRKKIKQWTIDYPQNHYLVYANPEFHTEEEEKDKESVLE